MAEPKSSAGTVGTKKVRAGVADRFIQRRQRREEAPEGFVTRNEFKKLVGLTEAQYRSLVKRGTIVSDGLNAYGYSVYTQETVERCVSMKNDGSLFHEPTVVTHAKASGESKMRVPLVTYSAADGVRVFELLDKNVTMKDIILATKIHPHAVRAICHDYNEITGSILLPKLMVDQINAIPNLPGRSPRTDGDALVECLELYSESRTCITEGCTAKALAECQDCLTHRHRLARQREREAAAAAQQLPQAITNPSAEHARTRS